jgi:hypothetical protein
MDIVPINRIAKELGVGKDYALRLIKRRAERLGLKWLSSFSLDAKAQCSGR